MHRPAAIVLASALAMGAAGAALAQGADPEALATGRRVAERSCGGCHAMGEGPSPLAEAPPFGELHRRYPPGGLPQILQEGMIAPLAPHEEGSPPVHPRMPSVQLGEDEVKALTAYLASLERRR